MKRIPRKWSDEELKVAVANSFNLSDVLRNLGLRVAGGNHKSIKGWIEKFKLDVSHFNNEKQLAGIKNRPTLTQEEVLCLDSKASKRTLKRVVRKILECVCKECNNIGVHNNKPLVLQLDHINGINSDNRIENLRWLCPNCHSQTPTFAGKSSLKGMNFKTKCECGKDINFGSLRCRKCNHEWMSNNENFSISKRKVVRPDEKELRKLIESTSFVAIGKMFGVSDTTIKNWAKRYKIIG